MRDAMSYEGEAEDEHDFWAKYDAFEVRSNVDETRNARMVTVTADDDGYIFA